MARVSAARLGVQPARERAFRHAVRAPRLRVPGWAWLLALVGGAMLVVAGTSLEQRIAAVALVAFGAWGLGHAAGESRPDPDARARVSGLERAVFQLALLGHDGGARPAADAAAAEAGVEPGPDAGPRRGVGRGGGLPGQRPSTGGAPQSAPGADDLAPGGY